MDDRIEKLRRRIRDNGIELDVMKSWRRSEDKGNWSYTSDYPSIGKKDLMGFPTSRYHDVREPKNYRSRSDLNCDIDEVDDHLILEGNEKWIGQLHEDQKYRWMDEYNGSYDREWYSKNPFPEDDARHEHWNLHNAPVSVMMDKHDGIIRDHGWDAGSKIREILRNPIRTDLSEYDKDIEGDL